MSFSQDNGYIPITFSEVMEAIRLQLNIQFSTTFTTESFVGTNWYKYFYTLVQRLLENETKTSEIFVKLQQYITTTNLAIQRPSVSLPGLIDSFASNGFVASVRKNTIFEAGKIAICVDTDELAVDFPATRLEICTLIKDFVAAGIVSEGGVSELITLSNGQQFEFNFYLPTKTEIVLRLTITASDNQVVTIPTDDVIRIAAFENINSRYRLGWDFEPQRYFTQVDAPWAATILLEWSDDDGGVWHDEVFEAEFYDLYTFDLEDIEVVVVP
jgi:hypothetical protein